MTRRWPFPKDLSWPVWHLARSLNYLAELVDHWPGVCFGSAGRYWKLNSPAWERRMDEAFAFLAKRSPRLPWIHGLRMLGQGGKRWPLASADSTNIARNHNGKRCVVAMANRIDAMQTPITFIGRSRRFEMPCE